MTVTRPRGLLSGVLAPLAIVGALALVLALAVTVSAHGVPLQVANAHTSSDAGTDGPDGPNDQNGVDGPDGPNDQDGFDEPDGPNSQTGADTDSSI